MCSHYCRCWMCAQSQILVRCDCFRCAGMWHWNALNQPAQAGSRCAIKTEIWGMCVAPRYGAGKQNSGFRQNLSSDETTDRTTSHLTDETTGRTTSHLTNPAKDAGQVIDETTSHLTKAASCQVIGYGYSPVSYTHLRAHETRHDLVCRLLLEKKKKKKNK